MAALGIDRARVQPCPAPGTTSRDAPWASGLPVQRAKEPVDAGPLRAPVPAEPHAVGLPLDLVVPDEAPDPRVRGVVAVVPHHEDRVLGHDDLLVRTGPVRQRTRWTCALQDLVVHSAEVLGITARG